MLEKLWTVFRSLPGWAQVLGWLLLWAPLAALFLWRRPGGGRTSKIGAVAVLLFGSIAYAGLTSAPESNGGSAKPAQVPPVAANPAASPSPSPSPSPSIQIPPTPLSSPSQTIAGALPNGIPFGTQKARVAKNVDGDTIWSEPLGYGSLALNATHKIRILEIDTPEASSMAIPRKLFVADTTGSLTPIEETRPSREQTIRDGQPNSSHSYSLEDGFWISVAVMAFPLHRFS